MRKSGVLLLFSTLLILLTACLQGEQTFEEMDVPEEVTIVDENNETDPVTDDGQVAESEETVKREIYLFDADGLVVPRTFELPKTKSAAMTVLEYMVEDGPITELLPNGFRAVLPAGTEILGLNLEEDGTLIIDVSEEFKNYRAEDEVKILQAMTYTLTQFDNIERIKLWINGENQLEMPVNGTPISQGYSRANGINIIVPEKPSLASSEAVTIYYPKQYHDEFYLVPVTEHKNVATEDIFTAVVNSLIEGPSYEIHVADVFNEDVQLVEKPSVHNGVLNVVFNEAVLADQEKGIIADDVMQTLVTSLTAIEEVEAVNVSVENKDVLLNEAGVTYDRPVTTNDLLTIQEKM